MPISPEPPVTSTFIRFPNFINGSRCKQSRRRARTALFSDDRDHPALVGSLVLGAARDEQCSIVQHAADDGADRAANMALLVHVAVVQHGVRLTAHHAVARRLALDES